MIIKSNKLIKIILFFITFFYIQDIYSEEKNAKIVAKVNNEIITNQDISNEKKFLIAFNEKLKNLEEKKLYNLAKDSLKKHFVKAHELKKHFKLNNETDFLKDVLENFYQKLNINNDAQKENFLKNHNISEKRIKTKLEIEALWNELIYKKYIDQINIDENKLKNKLKIFSNTNLVKSYLLSEILFNAKSKDEIRKKYSEILESISMNGFENTANIYSYSDSAKFGGKVGWVNEAQLSIKISKILKEYKIDDFTKPINIPGGFLILKINDIKMEKLEINFDEELKKLIISERNRQLDQFSSIYYKKIEANAKIDEN